MAPLPFGAPADKFPVGDLKLPKGFSAEVYASGIPNVRSLRLGDKGTLFVSTRVLDKVNAVVDGKRETKVSASGLDRPDCLAFHQGTLYVAEGTRISKLESIEDNLDNAEAGGDLQRFSEPSIARLEIHGSRARRQALRERRRAV